MKITHIFFVIKGQFPVMDYDSQNNNIEQYIYVLS